MRLLTWNTARRTGCIPRQIEEIGHLRPDVVALQEVTSTTLPRLEDGLKRMGLEYTVDTVLDAEAAKVPHGRPGYGLLVASSFPVVASDTDILIPWPERVLSVVIDAPPGPLELHAAHIPPGASHDWKKIETLEGLYKGLAVQSTRSRILCGDFNTPQFELPDGQTVTWAQYIGPDGQVVTSKWCNKGPGLRWDAGERNVLRGLEPFDLPDVFRALHGYGVDKYSWSLRRKGKEIHRRFDHVFASRALHPVSAEYRHEFVELGLSDHAPLLVVFEPAA